MGRVYREKTVPIPENTFIDQNKVMLTLGEAEDGKKNPKRMLIGYVVENDDMSATTLMHPNSNYQYFLPDL